jgi:hypothetical protein
MRQNRRNRCDEIIALIDSCLAEYEAGSASHERHSSPDRQR